MIRAIVINPIARTIVETRLQQDSEGSVPYDVLRAAVFPDNDLGMLDIRDIGAGTQIVIDDEGLLKPWDSQGFFALGRGDRVQTFAGVAVLLGFNPHTGDTTDCALPLQLIVDTCRWMEPQEVSVPAPTLTTFGPDGEPVVEYLAGRPTWDYRNQPG